MKTKTWKIGECCRGGIITVEISGKNISIIGKEWDISAGCNRDSNQSNAKEFTRKTVNSTNSNAYRDIDDFIEDLSNSYWASEILEWIESKIEIKEKNFWE